MINFKTKIQIAGLIMLACLLFGGCDSNQTMRERFGEKAVIMMDGKGNTYVVKHHTGTVYTVDPIEDAMVGYPSEKGKVQ